MSALGRKYEQIDLIKLRANCSTRQWNQWLDQCFLWNDMQSLGKVMYGLQAGMTELAKAKLNTPKIDEWFCRLTKSIEITARKIDRKLNPNPLDDSRNAGKFGQNTLAEKRKRDSDLQETFKKWRF